MTLMDSNHLTLTIFLSMQICFRLAQASIDHRSSVFTLLATPNGGPGKLHFFSQVIFSGIPGCVRLVLMKRF